MTVIEKMARAIFERNYLGTFKVDNGELERVWQQESSRRSLAFDQARAALAALEDPSATMIDQGLQAGFGQRHPHADARIESIFSAMICAAKEGDHDAG